MIALASKRVREVGERKEMEQDMRMEGVILFRNELVSIVKE